MILRQLFDLQVRVDDLNPNERSDVDCAIRLLKEIVSRRDLLFLVPMTFNLIGWICYLCFGLSIGMERFEPMIHSHLPMLMMFSVIVPCPVYALTRLVCRDLNLRDWAHIHMSLSGTKRVMEIVDQAIVTNAYLRKWNEECGKRSRSIA